MTYLVFLCDKLLQDQARFQRPLSRIDGDHIGQVAFDSLKEIIIVKTLS
jgi:hypothetical protein